LGALGLLAAFCLPSELSSQAREVGPMTPRHTRQDINRFEAAFDAMLLVVADEAHERADSKVRGRELLDECGIDGIAAENVLQIARDYRAAIYASDANKDGQRGNLIRSAIRQLYERLQGADDVRVRLCRDLVAKRYLRPEAALSAKQSRPR
jgi:hypothetical protein